MRTKCREEPVVCNKIDGKVARRAEAKAAISKILHTTANRNRASRPRGAPAREEPAAQRRPLRRIMNPPLIRWASPSRVPASSSTEDTRTEHEISDSLVTLVGSPSLTAGGRHLLLYGARRAIPVLTWWSFSARVEMYVRFSRSVCLARRFGYHGRAAGAGPSDEEASWYQILFRTCASSPRRSQ